MDEGTWTDIAKAVPAVVALVTLVVTLTRGPGRLRTRLKHDAEVVEKLPDGPARDVMLGLVERQARTLAEFDETAKRDVPMFVVSLLVAPSLGYLTIWLAALDEWWSWPIATVTGLFAALFVYGAFETGARVPRDADGKRLIT